MLVTVNADASVQIAYDLEFQNTPQGRPIDVIDIGIPVAGVELPEIRAEIDGRILRDVRPSEFVKPGFEVHLDRPIAHGGSGRLHVESSAKDMVFQDTTRNDYASLQITPTWFDDRFVVGTTHLQVAIQLLGGVKPEEVLHQGLPFTQKAATPKGTIVGWDFANTRLTGPHEVAVSFPKRDMQRVVVMSNLDLLLKWFRSSPRARITLGRGVRCLVRLFVLSVQWRHRFFGVRDFVDWRVRRFLLQSRGASVGVSAACDANWSERVVAGSAEDAIHAADCSSRGRRHQTRAHRPGSGRPCSNCRLPRRCRW